MYLCIILSAGADDMQGGPKSKLLYFFYIFAKY